MQDFCGKRAAITGAGSGIGRALAQTLSRDGCELFLSDINAQSLDETKRSLTGPGPCATAVVDVADREAVHHWAADIGKRCDALDLLVNNAGVALIAEAAKTPAKDFHWLMNINFWGVVHGCEAFLPLLEQAQSGRLVNISSVFGMIGVPAQSAYNASKFAVRGYSEALRQELVLSGSRVRLCCVHPGGIGTEIARSARNADPDVSAEDQHQAFTALVRTSADDAARQIIRAAARGKPRVLIGPDARFLALLLRFFPVSYPRFLPGLGNAGNAGKAGQ